MVMTQYRHIAFELFEMHCGIVRGKNDYVVNITN